MARYIARIIRALFVSCVGFGGGVGLMVFIGALVMKGDQHAFQYGLNAGLLFGGIFAAFLVGVLLPIDLSAHLFLTKGNYKEIWDLEQTREVTYEGPLREVVPMCREALLAVPYVKLVSEDMENLMVRASVGMSWRSSGEQMEVEINPLADNQWQLTCTSRSPSKTVAFDYAKNFENVEVWLKQMQNLIKKHGQESA